jgi:hypothetical protein
MAFRLASGEQVRPRDFERTEPDRIRYASARPYLVWALQQISSRDYPGSQIVFTAELQKDRPGINPVLSTHPGDSIVYAQRPGKKWLSRFVRDRSPERTGKLTLVLRKRRGDYLLADLYWSSPVPGEPGSNRESTEGTGFWKNHAFVYMPELVEPGTEIDEATYLASQSRKPALV